MAKTKSGGHSSLMARRSKNVSRRNSNADDAYKKNNIENGLYVHSSPPKVVSSGEGSSGSANIREYLRGGNIAGLEDVVLEGNGNKLLTQSSTDPRVRAFLKTLPAFMSKIDLVHDAAERGNLRDLKSLLDRRKIARSKDSQGMGLLHKAVLSGNTDLVEYLVRNYPETTAVTDHDGRTPLHYCAASKSPDGIYSTMSGLGGSDPQAKDHKGKTAANYMSRPGDLKVVQKTKLYSSSRKRSTPNKRSQKVATPPKREGLNINGANIRIWIHDQDLPKLERIVWEGQGLKLMKETSNNPKVRQFLNLVPKMMIKIKEVHQAVVTNDMEMLEAKVDQPELLSAKDQNGLNALHKSAALGQVEMCEWILQKNQSALFSSDKMGRTPLFYTSLPADGGETFDTLVKGGAERKHMDRFNKTAEMYRNRPGDLDASVVYEPPAAPRSGAGALDIPFSRGTSLAPSRAQSRAPSRNRGSRSLNPSRRNSASGPTPRRSKSTDRGRSSRRQADRDDDDGPSPSSKTMEFEDMSEVTSEELEKMILDGDREKLEQVVLSGRGDDLRGRSSWNEDVRKFLKQVPGYMENINTLHGAAGDGNLKVVRQLTTRNPRLAMARGKDGSMALHHMAKSGNVAGVKSLHTLYPPAKDVQDVEGRTPLHWASLSRSPGAKDSYNYLNSQTKHPDVMDSSGNTAEDYINNPPDESDEEPVRSRRNSNAPSRKSSAAKSRNNSRNASRNNSRNPSPTHLSTSNSRNPSPTPSNKSRNGSKNNSRNASPTPSTRSKKLSPSNSRNPSPTPSRKSKNGSRNNSRNPSPTPSNRSKGPSKNNSRNPSPENSRMGASPSSADAAMEAEVADHIQRSEKDGDLGGLTDVILRGDGRLLLGRSSSDEDTQQFLDRVPGILEGVEEIHAAAEAGETRKVVNLIDRRKKASIRDTNHSNILHKAVLHGHSDLVRTLVRNYPELLNQQDRAGRTPLHYAAVVRDGGHTYKILTRAGADDGMMDKEEYSPENYKEDKHLLTENELKEELKEGIPLDGEGGYKKRARPITKESEEGDQTPSSPSKKTDNTSSHSNKVNHEDYPKILSEEEQYLSDALGDGISQALSDINDKRPADPVGHLALALYEQQLVPAITATEKEPKQASKGLSAPGSGDSVTSARSNSSSIAMKTAFGESTPRLNGSDTTSKTSAFVDQSYATTSSRKHVRDKSGSNALHLAASKPHPKGVMRDLTALAGVEMLAERDDQYRTPRDVAAVEELENNVREIDEYVCGLAAAGKLDDLNHLHLEGFDHLFDAEDSTGRNIMVVADKKNQKKVVDFLHEASENEERREWLSRAILFGSLPHVQYITDSADLLLIKDRHGRSPLHLATLKEMTDIMTFLCNKAPMALSIGDNLERTPLHYAMAVKGVDTVAKVLVQAGAVRNIKDMRGRLPSFYFMKRDEIVQMITELEDEEE